MRNALFWAITLFPSRNPMGIFGEDHSRISIAEVANGRISLAWLHCHETLTIFLEQMHWI